MKTNAKDYVSIAQQFFAAYDAHDVDGMLALCADGALGRYAPYGRESVVPIRGGIDVIWRAFPNAVPNFRVKVIELIPRRAACDGATWPPYYMKAREVGNGFSRNQSTRHRSGSRCD